MPGGEKSSNVLVERRLPRRWTLDPRPLDKTPEFILVVILQEFWCVQQGTGEAGKRSVAVCHVSSYLARLAKKNSKELDKLGY